MDFAKILLIVCMALASVAQSEEDLSADFWKSLEDYKIVQNQEDHALFEKLWAKLLEDKALARRKSHMGHIEQLNSLLTKYEEYIKEHHENTKIPLQDALYNAALAAYKLGILTKEDDPEGSRLSLEKSQKFLEQIKSPLDTLEKSLYLMSLVLKSLGLEQEMLENWRHLAKITKGSQYGVYAHIALGDHDFFQSSDTDSALGHYLKAYSHIHTKLNFVDEFGLDYRILWASYRAGRNDLVLLKGKELFSKDYPRESTDHIQKARKDIADLLGNICVNHLKTAEIINLLSGPTIKGYGGAIALSTINRYVILNELPNAIEIAKFSVDSFSESKEYPRILDSLATIYKNQKNRKMEMHVAEKFVWILPEKSLWRSRNRDYPSEIDFLVENGRKYVKSLAEWYSEEASKTSNAITYSKAAHAYGALLESYTIQSKETISLKNKQADVYFYAKNYKEAESIYADLMNRGPLSKDSEEELLYRIILIDEINWRNLFQRSLGVVVHASTTLEMNTHLKKWKSDVDRYISNYQDTHKAWDLKLLVASAYRDTGLIKEAEDMWNELLLSKIPSQAQRSVAIRGVVASYLVNETTEKQVSLLLSFLRLENWLAYDSSLKKELLSVLSAACLKESQKLQAEGKLKQATDLLLSIAREFPDIENRFALWKEGTTIGATASLWKVVETESESYLSSDSVDHKDELLYLLALSQESQFDFKSALGTYLKLQKNFPKFANQKNLADKIASLRPDKKNLVHFRPSVKARTLHLPTSWSL